MPGGLRICGAPPRTTDKCFLSCLRSGTPQNLSGWSLPDSPDTDWHESGISDRQESGSVSKHKIGTTAKAGSDVNRQFSPAQSPLLAQGPFSDKLVKNFKHSEQVSALSPGMH